MDINFIGKWVSFIFFILSLVVFVYLFLSNTVFLKGSLNKDSSIAPETKKARFLVGFAYLFTSMQMALGLYYVLKLDPSAAAAHVSCAGFSMLGFSIVNYFTERDFKKFLLMFAPSFLGFAFLSLHIMESIGVFN